MQLKILVSIINWNNNSATTACLAAIVAIPLESQPDVYLIDNNSKIENISINKKVMESLKSIKIIKNEENKGFAGGHNDAIEYAINNNYDYICLLNNDTEIIDNNKL